MTPKNDDELDIVYLYATFWRMLSLAVHCYGSAPTGQLLVVISMVIMDRYGYQPTVTELADMTQLPKSSISRYVAAEMNAGMLEEFIDPHDRRRRRLRPTAKARQEQDWHAQTARMIHQQMKEIGQTVESREPAGVELVRMLKGLNQNLLADLPPGGNRKS
jgi:DNA-binding MarR family transcriptional regulator